MFKHAYIVEHSIVFESNVPYRNWKYRVEDQVIDEIYEVPI